MAVLHKRPEPKPPTVSAQRRLSPLLVVWVQTGEVLKARPDQVVERAQGSAVEAGRHRSDREDHFAEGGAVAQELQSDLGIRQLAEGLQDATSLSDASLGVLVAELWAADRTAQQLEVAFPDNFEISRELGNVHRGGQAADQDELALVLEVGLASAQLKAEVRAPSLQSVKGRLHRRGLARKAEVIQVGVDQLEPTL